MRSVVSKFRLTTCQDGFIRSWRGVGPKKPVPRGGVFIGPVSGSFDNKFMIRLPYGGSDTVAAVFGTGIEGIMGNWTNSVICGLIGAVVGCLAYFVVNKIVADIDLFAAVGIASFFGAFFSNVFTANKEQITA